MDLLKPFNDSDQEISTAKRLYDINKTIILMLFTLVCVFHMLLVQNIFSIKFGIITGFELSTLLL